MVCWEGGREFPSENPPGQQMKPLCVFWNKPHSLKHFPADPHLTPPPGTLSLPPSHYRLKDDGVSLGKQ